MRLIFAILSLCLAGSAYGLPAPSQLWRDAKINPKHRIALDNLVVRYKRDQRVYQHIQSLRANGVPAPVLFGLHYREASNSFRSSLAQGDPLTHRSRNVPRGRIPGVNPPYTWEQCAVDAVYNVDRLDLKRWDDLNQALLAIELYNGAGYRRKGLVSPYVWSGTDRYQRGKYVADGRFDPYFVDKQLGVAAILLHFRARGVALPQAFN